MNPMASGGQRLANIIITRAPPCNLLILRAHNGCCTKTHTWNKELGRWLTLDYNAGKWFKFESYPVEDIRSLGALINVKRGDPALMIVRGEPSAAARELMAQPNMMICRKLSGPSVAGTLDDIPRPWLMTDIDKFPCDRLELIDNPEAVVQRAIETMLPVEFQDVTCFYQFSASAGFKDGIAGIHIWWWLDRSVDSPTIKHWLEDKTKATQNGKCKVDCSIISGNIPHYSANPVINGGHDPLPQRTGFLEGEAEFVTLPTDLVIVRPRAAISLQWSGPAELQREYHKLKSALEFIPNFDDVEREERIKIGHAIKAQLGEAGRDLWLAWAQGSNAEKKWDGFQPNRITGASIYRLARDAGWSPPSDLAAPAEPETVPAPRPLPTGTVKEAAAGLTTAINDWIVRAAAVAEKRITATIAQASGTATFQTPDGEVALAMAGLGIGKTAAALRTIGVYLTEPTPDRAMPRRVIYQSPDHALAEDAAARFRAMFPNTPCQIHLGIERPDPDAPGFDDPGIPTEKKIPMCRRLADAKEVLAAHGDISTLCGSRKRGYCPHHPDHPKAAPATVCGRLKTRTIREGLLILAGPESLSQAAPRSFARKIRVTRPDGERKSIPVPIADLLIADEPRFPSMLGGVGERPFDVTIVEMQKPLHRFPGDPDRSDDKIDSACAEHALHSLARALSATPPGPLKTSVVRTLARAHDWSTIRKAILAFKAEPSAFIKPHMRGKELYDVLKKLKAHNGRLFRLARLTRVLMDAADALSSCDDNAESGLIERNTVTLGGGVEMPAVRLRWVSPVHETWAGIPTLLLDGTADPEIARRWFPNLKVIADATAATPDCVNRVQVHDKPFSYLAWAPRAEEPPLLDDKSTAAKQQRTAWNYIERLARLLVVRCAKYRGQGMDGIDVLAIMPERTEKALKYWFDRHGGMPAGLAILHFNKLRGQDGFGGVRWEIIVSRPQPPAHELERIAWTISGVRGAPVPNGKLPEVPAAYLMSDGTGRQATTVRHPDPWAERVRVALCDNELVQAEGRARAVRRTPDLPLDVEILTNIPLPIPINRLTSADEALADSHPARWLVAAGVVPVLGANGSRQFLGAVLGMDPNAVRMMLSRDPVWSEVLGAPHRAQTPYEKSLMAFVHDEPWHVRLEAGDRYAVPVLIAADTEDEARRRLATVGVTAAEVRKGRPAESGTGQERPDQEGLTGGKCHKEEPAPEPVAEARPATGNVVPIPVRASASIGPISASGTVERIIDEIPSFPLLDDWELNPDNFDVWSSLTESARMGLKVFHGRRMQEQLRAGSRLSEVCTPVCITLMT